MFTKSPTRHALAKRMTRLAAIPAGLLVSSLIVWNASYSAFSATTVNPGNSWATGSVALSDDDASNTAMFSAAKLKPGSTGTKCIKVTSTGTVPSAVKLYASNYSSTPLAAQIDLIVEEGTGGGFSNCTGFSGTQIFTGTLDGFGAKSDYASGAGTWTPTGTASEDKSYRFTYTVKSTAPNSVQGGTASLGFTWEAQNS